MGGMIIMNKLNRRFAVLRALFNRTIAFREGLILLLPSECVIQIARFVKPTSITLFRRDFGVVPNNYHEALDLIDTIITTDQYGAARFLKANSVVVDAGANIGAFSVFAATLAPHGSVYAFEPAPRAFELLKRNIVLYQNIHCYNLGLGNTSTRHKLYVHSQDTFSSTYEDSGRLEIVQRKGSLIDIDSQVITIDEFVSREHINKLDLIKIDTEGYEAKVIEGARNTITKHRPIIVLAGYHHPDDAAALPALVNSIVDNYKCSIEHRGDLTLICAPC
jgi:FkbM family methyltransferase